MELAGARRPAPGRQTNKVEGSPLTQAEVGLFKTPNHREEASARKADRPGGRESASAGQQSAGLIGTLNGTGLDTKGVIGKPGAHGGESGNGVSTTSTISPDHSPTGNIGKVKVWLDNIDSDGLKAGALDDQLEAWILQLMLVNRSLRRSSRELRDEARRRQRSGKRRIGNPCVHSRSEQCGAPFLVVRIGMCTMLMAKEELVNRIIMDRLLMPRSGG